MKYSLRIRKNKNFFKRHKILPQMHWTSNIFGPSTTTIEGFRVSLNYPILNFKKTVCSKNIWIRHWWGSSKEKLYQEWGFETLQEGRRDDGIGNIVVLIWLGGVTLIWVGGVILPCWFSFNNSETIEAITLAFRRIQ